MQKPSNDSKESATDSIDMAIENEACENYFYEDTIHFALPGESGDCPDYLVAYGDSLLSRLDTLSPSSDVERIHLHRDIQNAFTELQRYKTGSRKYYPQEEVCEILSDLQIYLTFFISHGGDLDDEIFNVFFRLMEQAVRFCPDINILSGVCSKDHYLGTLDFYKRYNNIMYYSLIYRKPEGQYGVLSFKGNGGKINHIRMMDDTKGYRRYLVSDESFDGFLSCSFKVWVIDLFSDGSTRVIIPSNAHTATESWMEQTLNSTVHGDTINYYSNPIYEKSKIIFNPRYIRWSFCNEKDGIFYPVENSQHIYLELEDNSARLRLK